FLCYLVTLFFFFFQAEDGIRDGHVTGVQTCALPISSRGSASWSTRMPTPVKATSAFACIAMLGCPCEFVLVSVSLPARKASIARSEERRVGKECRSRWAR